MKKHKVESQYKNPDKLIARLKSDLVWKDSIIKIRDNSLTKLIEEKQALLKSVLGEELFDWMKPENIAHTVINLDDNQIGKMKIGKTVYMRGKIIKIIRSEKETENSATMIFKTVFVKE